MKRPLSTRRACERLSVISGGGKFALLLPGLIVFLILGHVRLLALTAAGERERPNILFIAVDDLNDWVGVFGGHPDTRTPNMDRLAARGVAFQRAYTVAPSCNPSRIAVLAGVRPSTSGVYENNQLWRPALPEAVTLPEFFKKRNYRVMGAGKIFHSLFWIRKENRLLHSFESASWDDYREREEDPMPEGRPLNGIRGTGGFDWGGLDEDDSEMDDYKVVSWVIEQLERPHEKPFFLACGLFRPHQPFYVPRKYFEMFPLDDVTLPTLLENDLEDIPTPGRKMARPEGHHRRVMETGNYASAVRAYLASIAFVDGQIGRLLEALDASRYARNTIIVLWGDHGFHLGEKKHWTKFTLWEESCRVPLIIVAPGVATRGGQCWRTVSLLDLYPTLADLCDLPVLAPLEGVSLRALLEDPSREWYRPAVTTHGRNNHSIRSERWRYIRYADGSEELYDHDSDPLEWNNVAGDPDLVEVKRTLARWLPVVNVPPVPSTLE